jgi:oxygen-independent coproporphyrinogen-3 oxidase
MTSISLSQHKLGLYLHIPWCPTRCIYCDFNTYIDGTPALKARYHNALRREIREAGAALERRGLNTIFFGGGTPTSLAAEQLIDLVETVKASFALQPEAEITSEANPGALTVEYLQALRRGGINRLSLGVQSFDDRELAFLSRLHNAEAARQAVRHARRAGFDNLSLDLIFNLPNQSVAQWQFTLREALRLEPEHLSIYALIVEAGTPLQRQVSQGQVSAPDDDLAAEMYAVTLEMLAEAGYAHYEISNWARARGEAGWESPWLASAHNLIYWRNQPYLGLGAGAYGTLNGQRWANVKRPQDYIAKIEGGAGLGPARDVKTVESIGPATAMTEHMMLGLRLVREGVGAAEFEARFGLPLNHRYARAIEYGLKHHLLEWIESPGGPRLRLTRQGRFLANQVVLQFME